MKKIARSAIVEHGAAQVYALVEDIESYPRFLPWCLSARVQERDSTETLASLEVGMRSLRQSFTTRNTNDPGLSIRMRLVEGPFRHFAASWRFDALGPGACRIEFALEYEFSSRSIGKLLGPLFDHIANAMVDAFSRRAEQVYAR